MADAFLLVLTTLTPNHPSIRNEKMNIEDRSNVHIMPNAFEDMKVQEISKNVHSVPFGSAEGESIPLFTLEQAGEILRELGEALPK